MNRFKCPACGGTMIELFARNAAPGWDAWGDEIEGGVIYAERNND
jgi:N6-adenosine-specific RNA methylase IME4